MVMIVVAEKYDVDVMAEARATAAIHCAEPDGLCRGCLEFAARLAWSPCPQAAWAHTVLVAVEDGERP